MKTSEFTFPHSFNEVMAEFELSSADAAKILNCTNQYVRLLKCRPDSVSTRKVAERLYFRCKMAQGGK